MAERKMNILLGVSASHMRGELSNLVEYLTKELNGFPDMSIGEMCMVESKVDMEEALQKEHFQGIICMESLGGVKIGAAAIRGFKKINPFAKIILVVGNQQKGGVKLHLLYKEQYFDALYTSDFSADNIHRLLLDSRLQSDAYAYYDIKEEMVVELPSGIVAEDTLSDIMYFDESESGQEENEGELFANWLFQLGLANDNEEREIAREESRVDIIEDEGRFVPSLLLARGYLTSVISENILLWEREENGADFEMLKDKECYLLLPSKVMEESMHRISTNCFKPSLIPIRGHIISSLNSTTILIELFNINLQTLNLQKNEERTTLLLESDTLQYKL